MSLLRVFDVAGTAMMAQSVRLNVTTSNLANAETVSASTEQTYRARHPVFSTLLMGEASTGVRVRAIVESDAELRKRYAPDHPLADDQGYIYLPNVNVVEEMANMISASRSYQNSVEVMNTSKQMLMATLRLGQ